MSIYTETNIKDWSRNLKGHYPKLPQGVVKYNPPKIDFIYTKQLKELNGLG